VVAKQPDVRHEDTSVDIDPVQFIDVIAAVRLRDIPVSSIQVQLAARGTRIMAGSRDGVHSVLRHQPPAHVVPVEISANSQLRELHLTGPEHFAGTRDRVVLRVVEILDVIGVYTKLAREYLRIEW